MTVPAVNGLPVMGNFAYSPYPYYDIEDLDPTYSTAPYIGGMTYGPMGYGGSIFSMAPYGMMGMGNSDYFNQMRQYQQFYNDYNVDQQRMQRNADLRVNASMEAINATYNALKDKIEHNEQGQIEDAYKAFVQAVRAAYGDGTEQEIKARAASMYAHLSGGKTLVQDLREKSHGSFMQGVLNSMLFGLYHSNSAEDNIAKITGSPVATGDKFEQNVGRVVGGLGIGAIAGGIAKALKASGKRAGIIGLIAAGIAGTLSFVTGKVTT